jgi:hypothetical protein
MCMVVAPMLWLIYQSLSNCLLVLLLMHYYLQVVSNELAATASARDQALDEVRKLTARANNAEALVRAKVRTCAGPVCLPPEGCRKGCAIPGMPTCRREHSRRCQLLLHMGVLS